MNILALAGIVTSTPFSDKGAVVTELLGKPMSSIEKLLGKPTGEDVARKVKAFRGWTVGVKKVRVIQGSLYPETFIFELDGAKVRSWRDAARVLGLPVGQMAFNHVGPGPRDQSIGTLVGISGLHITWNHVDYAFTAARPCLQIYVGYEYFNRAFEKGLYPPTGG